MITISLCMIVKNEENTLPRCLDSVGDAVDEIVVVDTGSTDRTKERARQYTDRVYEFPWRDDFAAARNFAFDMGQMDYLMWLDGDDVLQPEDRMALMQLKKDLEPDTDVVMLPYHTAFDASGRPTFSYYRERLIRRGAKLRWEGAVHEAIAPAGKVVYREAAVTHRKTGPGDPDRNLRILEGLMAKGEKLTPRERFYYGRELTYHQRDREAARVLKEFLESGDGWVENNIQASRDLAGCYERLGKQELRFQALACGLRFGPPRAESCCELGRFFLEREEWPSAAYWYERALECPMEEHGGGFTTPECYGYVPALQLCVCCYRMGEVARAEAYNEMACGIKPDSEPCRYNRAFFDRLKGREPSAM